jgi:hypothetical protein
MTSAANASAGKEYWTLSPANDGRKAAASITITVVSASKGGTSYTEAPFGMAASVVTGRPSRLRKTPGERTEGWRPCGLISLSKQGLRDGYLAVEEMRQHRNGLEIQPHIVDVAMPG